MARAALSVSVTDQRGRPIAAGGLDGWLRRAAPASTRGAVGVALVSDAEMRRLNRRFRSVDRATDVLSFAAAGHQALGTGHGAPRTAHPARFLGDIAIARGVAARQARALGHSLAVEIRVLALHGLLHLLGYDHEADQGEMRRLEERLRRRAGLPVGLIARPSVRTHRR